MQLLAIDLGKQKSLACWFNTDDQTHRLQTVPTSPQAFHDLLVQEPVDRVVIEVCDIAGWVADLCRALSIPILVANAAGEGWRWRNVKNKTDRTDVLKLSRLAAGNELTAVHVPIRPIRFWRGLILYRHRLIERRTRIKNAIHALLVAEGRAMPAGRETWSAASLAKLNALAKPIEQCQTLEDLWAGHLHLELQQLDHLQQQIDLLDRKLDALGSADHRVIRLQTIPGVGPRLSELVVAVLDDPQRFASVRQVSLFPVVIAHASVNAPFFFWEQVATGPAAALLTRSSILAEASFVVVAIVLVKIEWRWWWIRPKRDATLPAAPPPDRY